MKRNSTRVFGAALVVAISFSTAVPAADASKKVEPAANSAKKILLPSDPDAAWKDIETASKSPAPPAEWDGKPPTAEQREAFLKFLVERSAEVAAKSKEFYTRFPDHAKAEEAKEREERFLAISERLSGVAAAEKPKTPEEQKLDDKINAVHRNALEKRAQGTQAVAKDAEAGFRALMKEYPNEPKLWEQMLVIAQNGLTNKDKKRVYDEIVQSDIADAQTKAKARAALKTAGAVGHPLDWSFTAADGRTIDFEKLKGKVVVVDFWAGWCGPCIAAMPEMVALYNEYHDKGVEIIGINMDKNRKGMDQVIAKFKMPWPQYFDGKGWGAKYALEYSVNSIPAIWLVDKKGILRTMEGRQNLEEQVKELLAEEL